MNFKELIEEFNKIDNQFEDLFDTYDVDEGEIYNYIADDWMSVDTQYVNHLMLIGKGEYSKHELKVFVSKHKNEISSKLLSLELHELLELEVSKNDIDYLEKYKNAYNYQYTLTIQYGRDSRYGVLSKFMNREEVKMLLDSKYKNCIESLTSIFNSDKAYWRDYIDTDISGVVRTLNDTTTEHSLIAQ